jgi:paraquat-inducible protein B
MLSGPTIVMVPGAGARESRFTGLERKPIDPSPNERPLIYGITLGAAAGSLKRGDPVKLRGFTVGEVRSVGFYYDPASGEISTPGTLAIYPSLFHVKGLRAPTARAVAADIATLVSKGLRVSLARNPPLVGSYAVRLAMQPGSSGPDVLAMVDGLPQLPMASGSGGIGAVVSQFEKVPIAKIAHNALDITRHIKTLTASPHLKDAIVQLDAALRQIHTMTRQSAPRIGPLIAQLRKAAADLQRTSASADVLLNGTATQSGVHTTLRQINQAAHAIRSLADYLDRHPEALLHGRPGGPQ